MRADEALPDDAPLGKLRGHAVRSAARGFSHAVHEVAPALV
ncbi:hypothetical protein ABIE67_001169 [Streptomyces sp. V4I8]